LVHHELEGHPYNFVVVHSSSLETQKEKTLQKRIGKQKEELTKQSKGLKIKAFACEPDAQAALAVFLQECQQKGFEVQGTVQSCVKKSYGHRGKPRNGEEPTITTTYHAEVSIGDIKPEVYQHLLQMESTFVLIANVKDRQKYDDQWILLEYKRQISIETKFRFLKNRVYLGPVYLENPKRIYALGYVFILVLLLASYLEYRVRKALKEQGEAVKLPGNKSTDRPSVQTILEVLGTIQIVSIQGQRYLPDNVNRQALNMVRWAGFNPEEIYLKPISLNA
jgi:transposase